MLNPHFTTDLLSYHDSLKQDPCLTNTMCPLRSPAFHIECGWRTDSPTTALLVRGCYVNRLLVQCTNAGAFVRHTGRGNVAFVTSIDLPSQFKLLHVTLTLLLSTPQHGMLLLYLFHTKNSDDIPLYKPSALIPLLVYCSRNAICHNPHNSSNWDSHLTRQLGYKHTFSQNVVSTKKKCPILMFS